MNGGLVPITFVSPESCKHIYAVFCLEFSTLLHTECSVRQMHAAPIVANCFRCLLHYSHSFLIVSRSLGSSFIINGTSFV